MQAWLLKIQPECNCNNSINNVFEIPNFFQGWNSVLGTGWRIPISIMYSFQPSKIKLVTEYALAPKNKLSYQKTNFQRIKTVPEPFLISRSLFFGSRSVPRKALNTWPDRTPSGIHETSSPGTDRLRWVDPCLLQREKQKRKLFHTRTLHQFVLRLLEHVLRIEVCLLTVSNFKSSRYFDPLWYVEKTMWQDDYDPVTKCSKRS